MTVHFSTCSVSVTDHVHMVVQLAYLNNGLCSTFCSSVCVLEFSCFVVLFTKSSVS